MDADNPAAWLLEAARAWLAEPKPRQIPAHWGVHEMATMALALELRKHPALAFRAQLEEWSRWEIARKLGMPAATFGSSHRGPPTSGGSPASG